MFEGEMILEDEKASGIKLFPLTKIVLVKETEREGGESDKTLCVPAMVQLLEAIDKTGKVKDSCAAMNISYSYAWKLLGELETWAGCKLTERKNGGRGGGASIVTQEGHAFLKQYNNFMRECGAAIEIIFEKWWPPNNE
jgi:molybdate transport system regulatory protein